MTSATACPAADPEWISSPAYARLMEMLIPERITPEVHQALQANPTSCSINLGRWHFRPEALERTVR